MNGDSAFQTQPAYVQKASSRKRLVIIFLVVLVLIIAALGALYLLGSSAKHPTPAPTTPIPTTAIATPTPATASAQLSPTAGVTIKPTSGASSLTVSVLNGSGTPGAAGETATALKSAGFTNVTTGNASVYTYTGITIHVKNKANLATVEKAIASVNPNAKITSGIDPTLPTDVEVIVGK
jgi:flagellar basal body-associated protein FliL